MKTSTWATALLLAILMIVGFGCTTDKSSGGGGDTSDVGTVQVYMYHDTVTFIPGDSVQAPGFVWVRDRQGRSMKNVAVDMILTPPTLGGLEWANTSLRDTTNDQGRVEFYFRSYARPGDVTITAFVGTVVGTDSLVVLQSSSYISDLTISLSKTLLRVSPTSEDSSQVTVSIKDSSGAGIPGIFLRLTSTGGRFKRLPPTDSTGRATTWWYNSGEFGTFTVTVQAGSLARSANITVEPLGERGTLTVTASPPRIRADGISESHIKVLLRDQYSSAVAGDTIRFSTPYLGAMSAWRITDDQGIAVDTFQEPLGRFSQNPLDSAWVVARHDRWGLFDTVGIYVSEASAVERVNVSASRNIGVAGVDSVPVTVNAYYEDGLPVDGIEARLFSTCGQFSLNAVMLYGGTHSQAPIYYKFCTHTTPSVDPAKIWAEVSSVTSDTLPMIAIAGPPRFIDVIAAPVIPMNEQLPVAAIVVDSMGNRVGSGIPVFFESAKGTMSPETPTTDDNGIAESRLWPGTEAGSVFIKGTVAGTYVDSTLVLILSGSAGTIVLSVANPRPQVRGTGGVDWTQVIAEVNDVHGNPVQDGVWVIFTILSDPGGGCAIIGIGDGGRTDSAQTNNGQARVSFNSGTMPGPVSIQACTYIGGVLRCVSASNINIVAGPPQYINIQPTDIGVDVGDGVAWDVTVGALVGDLYNNPVRNGIAVFFDIEPEIALVLSDSVVTGNIGVAGVARTVLRYPSDRTFDHVNITARTAGPNSVSTTIDYELPLQTPTITVNCEPSSWHYLANGGPWCQIKCEAIVRDGHNRRINGATVLFMTTRGRFWTTQNHTVEIYRALTGPLGNPSFPTGYAALWLCEREEYVFPPLTTEITADVQVEVQGYSAIDTQPVNFRRGTGL